jgi:hypothetical protein
MVWSISHGGTKHGYSGGQIGELGDELKAVSGWAQWRRIKVLFNRRSGDPFSLSSAEAALAGQALLDTAGRLPADSAAMARQIGESALRAARAGHRWEWS